MKLSNYRGHSRPEPIQTPIKPKMTLHSAFLAQFRTSSGLKLLGCRHKLDPRELILKIGCFSTNEFQNRNCSTQLGNKISNGLVWEENLRGGSKPCPTIRNGTPCPPGVNEFKLRLIQTRKGEIEIKSNRRATVQYLWDKLHLSHFGYQFTIFNYVRIQRIWPQ